MLSHRKKIVLIFFILLCAETTLSHSAFAQQRSNDPEQPPLFSEQSQEEIRKLIREKPVAAAFFGMVSLIAVCAAVTGIALIVWYLVNKAMGREILPQSPANDVSWYVSDGVIVLGCYIAVPLSIGLIWRALHSGNVQGRAVQLLGLSISALVNVAIILVVFWIIKFLRGGALSELGFKKGNCWRSLKIGAIGYLMAFPIVIGAGLFVQYILHLLGKGLVAQEIVRLMAKESSPTVLTLLIIYGALLGPILEEILFRGFLQPALRRRLGPGTAIGATALLFALMHLSLSAFASILILGIALGLIYERTQSLVTSITLHVLNNAAMMTILMAEKALLGDFF